MGYCFLTEGTSAIVDIITGLAPLQRVTAKSAPRNSFDRQSSSGPPRRSPNGSTAPCFRSNSGSRPSPSTTPAPLQHHACASFSVCPYYSACEQKTEEMRLRWLSSGRFRDYLWDPSNKSEETA
jgi:hypothetical protein